MSDPFTTAESLVPARRWTFHKEFGGLPHLKANCFC